MQAPTPTPTAQQERNNRDYPDDHPEYLTLSQPIDETVFGTVDCGIIPLNEIDDPLRVASSSPLPTHNFLSVVTESENYYNICGSYFNNFFSTKFWELKTHLWILRFLIFFLKKFRSMTVLRFTV
jgi:hypothetical protein